MGDLIGLLKIVLFMKIVLLTPKPVSFDVEYSLLLDEPISAINNRGHIEIDVTSMFLKSNELTFSKMKSWLYKEFPKNSIQVKLANSSSGEELILNRVAYAYNDESLAVLVLGESGVPVGKEFDQVYIKTSSPLLDVSIHWRNATM